MESCLAGTFFADIPILYWMPFQARATGLPRMTKMPSDPSTCWRRSFVSVDICGLWGNCSDLTFRSSAVSCFLPPASSFSMQILLLVAVLNQGATLPPVRDPAFAADGRLAVSFEGDLWLRDAGGRRWTRLTT